jgi:hypothetical protein
MTMAYEKHSAHAPSGSTDLKTSKLQPIDAPSVDVLPVSDDSVVVVTCKVAPSPQEIQETMATVRQMFPRNKVLIVNGNLNVSLLSDQQLRSLGLTRLH